MANPKSFSLNVSQIEFCILGGGRYAVERKSILDNNETSKIDSDVRVMLGHFTTSKETSDKYDNSNIFKMELSLIKKNDNEDVLFKIYNHDEIEKIDLNTDEKSITKEDLIMLRNTSSIMYHLTEVNGRSDEYIDYDENLNIKSNISNMDIFAHKITNDGLNTDLESFIFFGFLDINHIKNMNFESDKVYYTSKSFDANIDKVNDENLIDETGSRVWMVLRDNALFGFGQKKSIQHLAVKSYAELLKIMHNVIIHGKSENEFINQFVKYENRFDYNSEFANYLRQSHKEYGSEFFNSFLNNDRLEKSTKIVKEQVKNI